MLKIGLCLDSGIFDTNVRMRQTCTYIGRCRLIIFDINITTENQNQNRSALLAGLRKQTRNLTLVNHLLSKYHTHLTYCLSKNIKV